jgi:hypothetical protein
MTPGRMTQLYLARSSSLLWKPLAVSGMRELASYSIWQFSVSALNFAHSHSTAMMNPSLSLAVEAANSVISERKGLGCM